MSESGMSNSDKLYLQHIGILVCGFIFGAVAAYFITSVPFNFTKEFEEARTLGIVSLTILDRYPKSMDILNYLVVLGMPALFSIGSWFVWSSGGKRQALAELFTVNDTHEPKSMAWRVCLVLVAGSFLFLTFNINYFFMPIYNEVTGGWPVLGEEGVMLAWAQSILDGGVYAKEFSSGYAPMLLYPLAWLMKSFGATILTERAYTYLLNLAAYGIIIAFLYKTFSSKMVFVFSAIVYLIVFSPFTFLASNKTYLRVALGFLPLLPAYLYFDGKKRHYLPIIGIIAGQSLLFSQEVGICAVISLLVFFALKNFAVRDLRGFVRETTLIVAGGIVSVAPLLAYLAAKGALANFLTEIYTYPKLYALGYSALPFPSLQDFIAEPLAGGALLHYWVIFVYIFAAIYLIPLLLAGKFTRTTILNISLLVFGILLYRSALCRSDQFHVYFASQPAFLLSFLFLDSGTVNSFRQRTAFRKAGSMALVLALSASLCLVSTRSGLVAFSIETFMAYTFDLKKTSVEVSGYQFPSPRTGGVFLDDRLAPAMSKIADFLAGTTKAGDHVYFFPNEPAYYFLFDRKNPTRYAFSYQAITARQRREIVADLDRNRPVYVVYSLKSWRIDDIPEYIQVPELTEYLFRNYQTVANLGEALVLKRVPNLQ